MHPWIFGTLSFLSFTMDAVKEALGLLVSYPLPTSPLSHLEIGISVFEIGLQLSPIRFFFFFFKG